jgi:hypothetical protein
MTETPPEPQDPDIGPEGPAPDGEPGGPTPVDPVEDPPL